MSTDHKKIIINIYWREREKKNGRGGVGGGREKDVSEKCVIKKSLTVKTPLDASSKADR